MMQAMRWVAFAAGIVIVFATWASLVATLVLPRGESFFQRLSSVVLRALRVAVVSLARLTPSYATKDSLLSLIGPVGVLLQLAVFLAAFVAGAALQLVPWTVSFPTAFSQAAGSVFVVGLIGDVGPTNNMIRVLAAATGAVTIALQIGYLPAIYQSYASREALVARMESRAGTPAWGPEVLIRHLLVNALDAIDDFYRDWEVWAADVAESHGTHPVLVAFRSAEVGYSWVLSLLAVLDAAALQLALCPSTAPSSARMCLRMGFSALRRIATTLRWPYDRDPLPEGPIELDYADFASAVAQLVEAGLPVERTAEEAWPHFRGWRVNYESIAYRLADYLVAPHAPWSGERHHLPPDIVPPARPPHRSPDNDPWDDDRFRR
ncbi:MAG: hypothetical protein JWO62_686 [Acidimicrobiaceae bacterium]|jgi:hypothetical protein|nr:hypothetical protein [Acidimicrobiaceae bacterium]